MTDPALPELFNLQCNVNHESLTDLPSDVIRRIIVLGQESFNNMCSIFPRWNALSIEHLNHRNHLPAISHISFDNKVITGSTVNTCKEWRYRICVLDRYLDYFQIRNSKSNKIVNYAASRVAQGRMEAIYSLVQPHNIEKAIKMAISRISYLTRRCSRIEIFGAWIDNIREIKEGLGNVNIDKFEIFGLKRFSNETRSTLIDLIRVYSIQCLVLSFNLDRQIKAADKGFIEQALPLTRSVELIFRQFSLEGYASINRFWSNKTNTILDNINGDVTMNITQISPYKFEIHIIVTRK